MVTNVWDVTVALNVGDTIEYKYSENSWTIQEMNDPNFNVLTEILHIPIEYT